MRESRKRILCSALVIAVLAGLSLGCFLFWNSPAPERSITITDLLVGLDDMPKGWNLRTGPEEPTWEYNTNEGLEIVFEADSSYTRTVAAHAVLRYQDLEEAASIYEDYVAPSEFGKSRVPEGWTYHSVMADPYYVYCYEPAGESQDLCVWSGLYDEYIVVFHTWLIPARMTLEDFASIVRVIDQRTACSLSGPCLNPSRRGR